MTFFFTKKIRNFAIIAHIDHGKSTLADRFLELTNLKKRNKQVERILDSLSLEQKKGITIKLNAVQLCYPPENSTPYIFNLIDTPGHVDFMYEVSRSLAACEGVLLLVDATKGIQAQSLAYYQIAKNLNLKILPVINKIELPSAQLTTTKNQLIELLNCQESDIALISAKTGKNIDLLLKKIIDEIPAPLETEKKELKILVFDLLYNCYHGVIVYIRILEGELKNKQRIKLASNQKTYQVDRLGVKVPEETLKDKLITGEIGWFTANIRDMKEIKVGVGDIVAAIGLKHTATGDTLGEKNNTLVLEEIKFAEPVINLAIEPESSQEQDKLSKVLNTISEEDPTFRYWFDQETKQMIIAGMGELHLEVLIERLRSEFKVRVNAGKPQVSYRETITKKVEKVEGEYKKQTGGSGHFAWVKLTFEANKDKGFEFVDAKKGQGMTNKDAEEVKEGIIEAMSSGLLLGYPLLDLKATLLEGKRHDVDTKPGDFKNAAILAFRGDKKEERQWKAEKLGLILLEPIMKVEVMIPKDYYGNILASLTSRRGEIEKTEENEQLQNYTLYAKVPLSEMFDYSTPLRSLSGGRGNYSMKFSHYQEVPDYILNMLLEKK